MAIPIKSAESSLKPTKGEANLEEIATPVCALARNDMRFMMVP